MNYWLMKSEPDVFGIDHLKKLPKKTDHWDGVRNYQARNMMRDEMKKGDQVFFYHRAVFNFHTGHAQGTVGADSHAVSADHTIGFISLGNLR